MALSRYFIYPFVLAAALTVGLTAARADDTKPDTTPAVPAEPDRSKDKPLPEVFDKANPENIDDLKVVEKHVKEILGKVLPATVCVQVGASSGSGVIVHPGHFYDAEDEPMLVVSLIVEPERFATGIDAIESLIAGR